MGAHRSLSDHASRTSDEAGFLSIQYMVAVGLSLLFLVMMTDFVVIQYGRGIVRAAADEGARAGARVVNDPLARCEQRSRQVLQSAGKIASDVDVACAMKAGQVEVTTSAKFQPWVPGIPVMSEKATAISHKETAP